VPPFRSFGCSERLGCDCRPGKFYCDERVNRAVSQDGRAILEALVKVYDARHLVDELAPR